METLRSYFFLILAVFFFSPISGVAADRSEESTEGLKSYRWSFGVKYTPWFSRTVTYSENIYFYRTVTTQESVASRFTPEWSYAVHPRLRIIATFEYGATVTKWRYEKHHTSPLDTLDTGQQRTDGLQKVQLIGGLRYYLLLPQLRKVTAYVDAGFGKQFAFATATSKLLFPEPDDKDVYEDNREEYLSQINSPWVVLLSFGVEYFMRSNVLLSMSSRHTFTTFSGKYHYYRKNVWGSSTSKEWWKQRYKQWKVEHRASFGLRFYF
ncbi:MAG: hypothetical protein ACE5QV_09505 [Fidelibacterota bacterium]